MTNVINDMQPEYIFIPFLPVEISQKYLLPEMENSLLMGQMITVFKSSTRLPCVKSEELKTDRLTLLTLWAL